VPVLVDDDSSVKGPVFAEDRIAGFAAESGCDLPLLHQLRHQLLRVYALPLWLSLQRQDLLPIALYVQF